MGEVEDTGAGLAALPGALTSGAMPVNTRQGALLSLFSLFLYWNCLEVAVLFVRKHAEGLSSFFISSYSSLFPFCSTTVQLCIVFHNLLC